MRDFISNRIQVLILVLIFTVLLCACILTSCSQDKASAMPLEASQTTPSASDTGTTPADPSPNVSVSPVPSGSSASDPGIQNTAPLDSPPSGKPIVSKDPEPLKPTLPFYDFSVPVPESDSVDDDYFSDAVFIGDSRTDGFRLYAGLNTPTYLSAKCITVINVGTEKVISAGNGSYVPILSALSWSTYHKVYIMLGINEIGLSSSSYSLYYSKLIESVRTAQPDASIYLQALIPVSEEKDSEATIYNNDNIKKFNGVIASLADEYDVYYIDTYAALADENGFLPADASVDGIHMNGTYCKIWRDYLRTHTVEPANFSDPAQFPEEAAAFEAQRNIADAASSPEPSSVPSTDPSPDTAPDLGFEGTPNTSIPELSAGVEPDISAANGPSISNEAAIKNIDK